ncbi:MAG: hypothetical protein IH623_25750 [Verrucomicrobia bacterium]|nr:hypothetical protein [Verrucomicrobiota bacterium]
MDLFKRRRAVTMPEMKAALGTPVDVTVFRKLATLDYFTSYSHRGGFYTLHSIARFDDQGLWQARGAWFSRYGTLLDTAPALVKDSAAGYYASELEELLQVPVKDALRELVRAGRVHREDNQGRYLYASKEHRRLQEQRAARVALQQSVDEEQHQRRAAGVLFYSLLDEQQRRLYAGLESLKQGHGGDRRLAELLGLDEETVARGRRELLAGQIPSGRIRRPGGGRLRAEKKRPPS